MQWRPHTPMTMRRRWNTWYQIPGSRFQIREVPTLRRLLFSAAKQWGNLWSLWQIWWRSRAMLASTLLNVFGTEKHCHCPTWQTHTHFWMKNENNAIYKTLNEMSSESQKLSVRCYCFQLAKRWKLHWENLVAKVVIYWISFPSPEEFHVFLNYLQVGKNYRIIGI